MHAHEIWNEILNRLSGQAIDHEAGFGRKLREEYICRVQREEATVEDIAEEINAEAEALAELEEE